MILFAGLHCSAEGLGFHGFVMTMPEHGCFCCEGGRRRLQGGQTDVQAAFVAELWNMSVYDLQSLFTVVSP